MGLKNKALTILLFISFIFPATSDCDMEQYSKMASEKLTNYTYLKTYKLDSSVEKELEFSYVFSKNTKYMISLAQESPSPDVKITIYDSNRGEICNNLDPKAGKMYPGIGYSCSATGIYFITYSFKDAKSKCAASVLGFKK